MVAHLSRVSCLEFIVVEHLLAATLNEISHHGNMPIYF